MKRLPLAALGTAVVAATILSACSSGKSSSGTSGSTTTGSGGSSTSGSGGTAAAQAFLDQHYTRPTKIPVTEAFTKPFPKDKIIDFIQCPLDSCVASGAYLASLTSKIGWTLKVLPMDGTPTGYQGALAQALRDKPAGVVASTFTPSTVTSQLAALKAAGIPVVTSAVAGDLPPGVVFNIDNVEENAPKGRLMAAYTVAKSSSKPSVVYVNLPDLEILSALGTQFKAAFTEFCSDCKLASIDVPLSAIGTTAASQVVSYLRSHNDVNTVVVSVDPLAVGLPAALKAAGKGSVKIIGESPSVLNVQYIRTGDQLATGIYDGFGNMAAEVDALARSFTGQTINQNIQPPLWIVDKGNLPAGSDTSKTLFPTVADFEQQYLKLWNVS